MASLFGRIFRAILTLVVLGGAVVVTPARAAPYAAIAMDARTGEILFEENARTRLHPASLTKMMTLYIVFQEIEAGRLSLDTRVTVSKYAAAQPPSRLGLKPGQKISVRHLIRAAAVKSANDAAAALGDAVSGDHVTFAKRMTKTARSLGMYDTTFKNPHGLTAEGHLSTAYDMTILGRHLFYDFPQYYNIFSRRTADAGIAEVRNTNTRFLDAYEGADGIKTGYTSAAGFNLTASAVRGDKRIIATIFGGNSTADRNARMRDLMDLAFDKARNRVKEQPPVAPEALPPDEALIASAEPEIDEIDAEGGAGKTIRVSGEVKVSLRPKRRPDLPEVPDTVAVAMAEGIAGALAEATAEPAPEGTLDFQAEAIAAGEPAPVLAEAAPAAGVTDPTSLDAQAAALAAGLPPAETPPPAEVALAEVKPMPRPADLAPDSPEPAVLAEAEAPAEETAPEVTVPETLLAEAAPEVVVTDPGTPEVAVDLAALAPEAAADEPLPGVTDVETVAAPALLPPDVAATAPTRRAPIFDLAEVAPEPAPEPQEVVVVMSTAGGRHFGVNVGEFPSRYDAERALLKTALAESATLNEGLRKTTQSGGAWRASFMGLTEEQAELACRRLRARAVPCETVGG